MKISVDLVWLPQPARGRALQTRGQGSCRHSPEPSHLCLQGEPGPPGQTGPEGPGGQQGSPGTQGRTVQGPVVGVASTLLHCLTPTARSPRPLPGLSLFPLQGPPGVKGEKGDRGLPGLQVVGEGLGDRACSGSDLAPPCQHLCSLAGLPRPPGRPRGGWPPGSKGGREARGEALEMEAVGGASLSLTIPSILPTQGLAMGGNVSPGRWLRP